MLVYRPEPLNCCGSLERMIILTPSEGPSSPGNRLYDWSYTSVPIVAQYRQVLQPEFGVFQLRSAGKNETVGMAGIVDAIAYNLEGAPELVFDWKSDVAPTQDMRKQHAAQVREYLDCTKAARGLVVYMTTGEVYTISQGRPLEKEVPGLVQSPERWHSIRWTDTLKEA